MKKVKFTHHPRAVYALLCAGIVAVGAASYLGYRHSVSSAAEKIISPETDGLDYSAVDAVLRDIQKTPEVTEPPAESQTPEASSQTDGVTNSEAGANPDTAGEPQNPGGEASQNGMQYPGSSTEQQADDALRDLTNDLEALYYQEAVMMPVNGEIVSAYSGGELVKSAGGVWRTHDGVDIAAAEGETVKSMTSGTVSEIYSDPLWGNCVVVDHGNTLSGYYFGLADDVSVDVGEKLAAGAQLGKVGTTADIESDLGPHLHFALKYQGKWIDPVEYVEPVK